MSGAAKRVLLLTASILLVSCGAAGCKKEAQGSEGAQEKKEAASEKKVTTREVWLNSEKATWDEKEVKEALEHVKNADLKYPTVKDAAMAARCADIAFLEKIKENGFTRWDAPEIMIAACKTPFPSMIRSIHLWGGDVHAKDEGGSTALMYAAGIAHNLETVRYLVSQGRTSMQRASCLARRLWPTPGMRK